MNINTKLGGGTFPYSLQNSKDTVSDPEKKSATASVSGSSHHNLTDHDKITAEGEMVPISHRTLTIPPIVEAPSIKPASDRSHESTLSRKISSKAEERIFFMNLAMDDNLNKIQKKSDEKKDRENIIENLFHCAISFCDKNEYSEAYEIGKSILKSIKNSSIHQKLPDALRLMSYVSEGAGDFIGALNYFSLYLKHTKKINVPLLLHFSYFYLGLNTKYVDHSAIKNDDQKSDSIEVAYPCFNFAKGIDILFTWVPKKITARGEWDRYCTSNPSFKPLIEVLVKLKNKRCNIKAEIEKMKSLGYAWGLVLGVIAVGRLIQCKKYGEAEELIGTELVNHIFFTAYFKGIIHQKKGSLIEAFEYFFVAYAEGGNRFPIYEEFSALSIQLDAYKCAIDLLLEGEHFFRQYGYLQISAYYNLQVEIIARKIDKRSLQHQSVRTAFPPTVATVEKRQEQEELQNKDSHSDNLNCQKEPDLPKNLTLNTMSIPDARMLNTGTIAKNRKPVTSSENADELYFSIQGMIDKYSIQDSAHDIESINSKLTDAISKYPHDLWLLHVAGWWYYECGRNQDSRELLLTGLKITLGYSLQSFKLPTNAQQERKICNVIITRLDQCYHGANSSSEWSKQKESRDIASFLSAYAYLLCDRCLWDEASSYRNWADKLDSRRREKYTADLLQTKINKGKVQVVPEKEFHLRQQGLE